MSYVRVFHGASAAFEQTIRDHGLMPPPGHGKGVIVFTNVEEAKGIARLAAAGLLAAQRVKPRGIVCGAVIDEKRVVDRDGILRVPRGIQPEELRISKAIDFPDLYPEPGKPNEQLIAALEELDVFRRLTTEGPRTVVGMNRGKG